MKYCGIDLKSNEARIISIETNDENYTLIATQVKKIKLTDSKSQEGVISFREDFNKFFVENNFDIIGIKERGRKGRFAGGADSFKMEGILQTLDYPIEVVHGNTAKAKIKDKVLITEGVLVYQEEALKIAVSFI